MNNKFTFIDLFSGCGGLSEGFYQQGLHGLAHVEWETPMVNTLKNRLVKKWGYSDEEAEKSVIHFDIQKTEELLEGSWSEDTISTYGKTNASIIAQKGIDGIVGDQQVDLIIGGPPCQAYSLAGRAQDPNSMKNDYRNYLFESFVKVVDHYRPKVFVFENVPGILSAKPGDRYVIDRICEAFDKIGYEIRNPKAMSKSIYSSADFGVPQERRRVIIFGVDKKSKYSVEDFYASLDKLISTENKKTVRDAIGDMPKFRPLKESYKSGNKNVSHELVGDKVIPLHEARYHNARDIEVFRRWISESMNDIPNEQKLEFYKQVSGRTTNHNKYRSLEWDKPSPTIVSHLYKDGLMFIHPDVEQVRSITIREAALLQTFPMDYEFIGSSAYCFKMIGNAVPVLFAKNIAQAIVDVLEEK
jgi:DNA (cytosine-5)-methyltransferase 1